ncbi:MAG: succinyl-diaminopimelate desuccinylase [Gammaproteobacteria bacterium]|nr:succinyl-diaminopimelate desuccinylase [Gammaproteobacteria bacterium]
MSSATHSETIQLTCELIARPSVTPEDEGCQAQMAQRLKAMGFEIHSLVFDEVTNLWARRGHAEPLFVFAGHTDVVPTGPVEQWTSPPFEPTFRDGFLFGRGAADMKGSLAAMIVACERFIEANPTFPGSIGFLITSDEEGPAKNGTVRVMDWLDARDERIDYTVVGEPSSTAVLGDVIKHGRRGSLNANVVFKGTQGHIAYPETTNNPIHAACRALGTLVATRWDTGSADFPPTSFQVSNINAGTGATNVVPGSLASKFNFRYSTALRHDEIQAQVEEVLDACGCEYEIEWQHSGAPFLTNSGRLLEATETAIEKVMGIRAQRSTSGGTSDGRFIAPRGSELVELGPINATIHQIDECVPVDSLDQLTDVYEALLQEVFR